jgi:hypothetical protein
MPIFSAQAIKTFANQQDNARWETRWQSIRQVIDGYRLLLNGNVEREPVLACLLDNLKLFGEKQFRYFKDKLDGQLNTDVAYGYTHEYGLTRTLTQLSYDLNAISQAMLVRQSTSQQKIFTLKRADEFAIAMLEAANTSQLFGNRTITALTYFRQSMRVRVVPYAPVALVGIPYTCLPPNSTVAQYFPERDFLPIPHEVGHYVYTHGKYQNGPNVGKSFFHSYHKHLRDQNLPSWVRYWAEEIFADVYGCRVGGPLMALSAQDIALEVNSRDDFLGDDSEHPNPYLRPDIYLWTLEAMGLQNQADVLRDRWQDLRNAFVLPHTNNPVLTPEGDPVGTQLTLHNGGSDAPQVLRQQLQLVVNVVNGILDQMQITYVPRRLADLIADAKNNPLVNTDGSLDNFVPSPVVIDDGPFNPCVAFDYDAWQTEILDESAKTWGWDKEKDKKKKKRIEWGVVLRGRGWDDEGPQGSPPTGG